MKSNSWKKPELIILLRSNPMELVLTACKNAAGPAGPAYSFADCNPMNGICYSCDTLTAT